ncbi:glycoside hydrolase family 16 protein [Nonomuraea gerenzanensis]|uniref:Beta-glucanase n=1 Tax=Nonomuraea gerenzanensis TaxID=93944 RepID=A0A1M4DY04_9ACTN|nr:glycoside hydrolase family 16 protein [Nonomuraea gerenzanensis]UBU13775.1 glycoside hydrolase family 16 protein [Nonomuraea gerenzanensis]SBO91446.1 Beta-glucanase precursor [Nonomuraea gerenzanensis]
MAGALVLTFSLAVAATLYAVSPPEPAAVPAERTPEQVPAGWRLVWADEFDGPAGPPDPAKWNLVDDHLGYNNELEYYTPRNAAVDGRGRLVITARSDDAGAYDCSPRVCAATSARLFTAGKFVQRYGRIEARIKLPEGQGMWPAFWARRSPQGSGRGEIDIMEHLGREPDTVHGSLHGEQGYDEQNTYRLPGGARFADDFHVFAADWYPDRISFLVDGQIYATEHKADAPPGGWDFDVPYYLLLNLAVGGDWPGPPDATTRFPQQLIVDHVRVYAAATDPPR